MKKIIIGIIGCTTLVFGAWQQNDRDDFINGCISSASKSICECSQQKLEEKYPTNAEFNLIIAKKPAEFSKQINIIVNQCVKSISN